MKYLTTLLVCMITAFTVYAQVPDFIAELEKEFPLLSPSGTNDVNEEFLLDSLICTGLIPNSSDFGPTQSIYYSYDGQGRLDTILGKIFDVATSSISAQSLSTFTYSGDTTFFYRSVYDFPNNQYVPVTRSISTFDGDENPINSLVLNWDANLMDYVVDRFFTYEHNAAGFQTEFISAVWDPAQQEFVNSFRSQNTYNAMNVLEQELSFGWNTEMMIWQQANRKTNSIISDSLIDVTVFENWNGTDWQGSSRDSFTYTFAGTRLFRDVFYFDFNINDWQQSSREYYIYQDGFAAGGFIQNVENGLLVNSSRFRSDLTIVENNPYAVESSSELWIDDVWVEQSQCDFYWNFVETTAVDDLEPFDRFCKMANPYSIGGLINCEMDLSKKYTLRVYDLMGKEVIRHAIGGEGSFSLNKELQPSMYIMALFDGQNLVSKNKVIVH